MRKFLLNILFIVVCQPMFSQEVGVLQLSEYLGYIKKYHPIVKQANLVISESEAKLIKARGLFDPKFDLDYNHKNFKDTEYFRTLNAAFKVPTWYGVEIKGSYERASGEFLNPEFNVPNAGLFNVGVSVSVLRDFIMNKRMATLKQAKIYQNQALADNQILVNDILFEAILTYFDWLRAYQEKQVFEEFLENAKLRFDGVKRNFEVGENPAIDTTEARIAYFNRKLSLEKARLNYIKASLELSNFLWIDNIPVEIQNTILPDTETMINVDEVLDIQGIFLDVDLAAHPKLQSLEFKTRGLEIERSLKRNNLLPKVDLQYNFLNETLTDFDNFSVNNYKAGIAVNFPLFLGKERGELRLTNYKLQFVDFERQATELALKNKLNTVQESILSYENQIDLANDIVSDYRILLSGEERRFDIGESSLFLINSREAKLIDNKLKVIELQNLLLDSKGKLFNVLVR